MHNIYTVVSIPSTNLFHVKVQEELHNSKRWNERAEESANPEETKQNTDIGRISSVCATVSASCLNNNDIFFYQHKVRTKAEPRNSIIKLKLRLSMCS